MPRKKLKTSRLKIYRNEIKNIKTQFKDNRKEGIWQARIAFPKEKFPEITDKEIAKIFGVCAAYVGQINNGKTEKKKRGISTGTKGHIKYSGGKARISYLIDLDPQVVVGWNRVRKFGFVGTLSDFINNQLIIFAQQQDPEIRKFENENQKIWLQKIKLEMELKATQLQKNLDREKNGPSTDEKIDRRIEQELGIALIEHIKKGGNPVI